MVYSEEEKQLIAEHILNSVKSDPKVVRYTDNDDMSEIDIFIGLDNPYQGVTTYSTIGLSNFNIGLKTVTNKDLKVEFIGATYSSNSKFGNIISSCSFNVINSHFRCHPGVVYPNVINNFIQIPKLNICY